MKQTLGQKRVKAEFNPAKNDLVDQIKNKSAELIDLIETMRPEAKPIGPDSDIIELIGDTELDRVMNLAQEKIETGCMYAVKACFTNS